MTSNNNVIEIENLSKIYDLGLIGTGSLSKDLNRSWAKLMGKPDPYLTIAELNDRTKTDKSGIVYALKDINFSVEKGEVLGIIGKNGAGKSTLLKILSEITSPSSGEIRIKGRVASLLEVGTGMHPEMTARQNIFLNGSLMGMTRKEIKTKLDEIVDFAGILKYVDTPIKRFSSGMQVRLGFAIAAFLEPEILIVDEVLAVGDAEFQKKAIGKIKDVSKGEGRTVLFVSHNMSSVKKLCSRSLVIDKGVVDKSGDTDSIIKYYLKKEYTNVNFGKIPEDFPRNDYLKHYAYFKSILCMDLNNQKSNIFYRNQKIKFLFEISILKDLYQCDLILRIGSEEKGDILYLSATNDNPKGISLEKGNSEITLSFNQNLLPGNYWVSFSLLNKEGYPYDSILEYGQISIENLNNDLYTYPWGSNLGSTWNKVTELQIK